MTTPPPSPALSKDWLQALAIMAWPGRPHDAMAHAVGEKFRPIVMITLAAILGMLPLALGRGLGSEWRNAIGFSSIGGIAVSAVLTLVVLPVLYDVFTPELRNRNAKGGEKRDLAEDASLS